MNQFKNILVGVDLAIGDRLVSDELSPTTLDAIERGIKLAKVADARLHFFYSLDISAQAQRAIEEDADAGSTVLNKSQKVLDSLVDRARQQGIDAQATVTFGKSWVELIRCVLRNQCDFVVVGSQHRGTLERLFIGSTGMNLLRSCPCPVWITHPTEATSPGAVLVAHDLTEVGERALQLGALVADFREKPLHVVHVIEPHHVEVADALMITVTTDPNARPAAEERIAQQVKQLNVSQPVEVHIAEGSPDTALQEQIKEHGIDLLVMGTLARSGIEGLLIGNTAERLLPEVPCSVLTIKPEGFRTPITLD